MKPKQLQSWNDAHTQINIQFRNEQELLVSVVKQSGSFVKAEEVIATYSWAQESRKMIASESGILVWTQLNGEFTLGPSGQFQKVGTIVKSKEDAKMMIQEQTKLIEETQVEASNGFEQRSLSSQTCNENVVKLSYANLGDRYCERFYVVKWKVSLGDYVQRNTVVGLYESEKSGECEFIINQKGQIDYLAEIGHQYTKNDVILHLIMKEVNCKHTRVEDGYCMFCREKVVTNNKAEICFPGWQLDEETVIKYTTDIIRDTVCLRKKLILVLDLDQTILHAIKIKSTFDSLKYLNDANQQLTEDIMKDKSIAVDNATEFNLDDHVNSFTADSIYIKEQLLEMNCDDKSKFLIKMRPYYQQFFREMIPLYDIYIYTKASRSYATFITAFLNQQLNQILPHHKPFFPSSKIITRDDTACQNSKSLNRIFPPGVADNLMIILDDNPRMWEQFKSNLIATKPYWYFKEGTGAKDAQGIANEIEDDIKVTNPNDTWLWSITNKLKLISQSFWTQVTQTQQSQQQTQNDLNLILTNQIQISSIYSHLRTKILQNVHLYFAISQTHPQKIIDSLEAAKKKAQFMGAKVFSEFKEQNHFEKPHSYVITYGRKKIKSITVSLEKNIPLIHYKWIEDCDYYMQYLDIQPYLTEEVEEEYVQKQLKQYFFKN